MHGAADIFHLPHRRRLRTRRFLSHLNPFGDDDEPEILPYATRPLCLMRSDGGQILALALYVFTGAFGLPVAWMQHKMRDLARETAATGKELPTRYEQLYRA